MKTFELEIMHFLNKLKEQSLCIDKQVACVIVDETGMIVSSGVNMVIECNKNCHDKTNRVCRVEHAESRAYFNLREAECEENLTAYVNLFPCVPCQNLLACAVEEIVVFGPRHKDQVFNNIRLERDLYQEILDDNGKDKQLSVAQGELAELITMISDYFYRSHKNIPLSEIADEIIDAELMIDQVKKVIWKIEPEIFNMLRRTRKFKYLRLLQRIEEGRL